MAKDLRYYLRFDTNGRKVMRELGIDAKTIDAALDAVGVRANKAKQSMMGMATTTVVLQGITQAVGSLQGAFASLTAKYDQQVAAEVRLEQAMRNTMEATDSEIQSIKDLASAQQAIGIIGDEVQLAGAQELSTYLTKKSSLETLIPVMNDMIAQQYAYNATAEAATSIATMLGKVMNGQVSALSRYGYSFDEAQAKILKFGTEAERARVLAEVVGESVGGMNEKLAQTDSGRMVQLANAIGDVGEKAGGLASKVMPFMTWVNQATILRNNMVQLGATTKIVAKVQEAWNRTSVISSANMKGLSRSLVSVGVSARTAVTATKAAAVAIRGLMCATVAGAAVMALGYACEWLTEWLTSSADAAKNAVSAHQLLKDATEAEERTERSIKNTRAESLAGIDVYLAKLKNFKGTKKDEKKLIEELNSTYGEQMGYFSSLNKWYEALIANGETYCQVIEDQIEMEELRERKADLRKKMASITNEDGGVNYELFKPGFWENTWTKLKGTFTGESVAEQFKKLKGSAVEAGNAAKQAILDEQAKIDAKIEANAKRTASRVMPMQGADEPYSEAFAPKSTDKPLIDPGEIWDLKGYDQFVAKRKYLEKQIADSVDFLTKARYEKELEYLKEVQKQREFRAKMELEGVTVERFHSDPTQLLATRPIDIKIEKPELIDVTDEIAALNSELRETVNVMDELQSAWGALKGGVDGFNTLSEAINGNGSAWERLSGVMDGAFQIYNGITSLLNSFNTLQAALKPILDANAAAKQRETAATQENTTANVANTASKLFGSFANIPFAGIALGLAAVGAMVAAMTALPKFAKGGLAFGPTLGLFGEYSGASNNPEVVAPLNTLKKYLEPVGGYPSGKVEFLIRRRDLVGVLEYDNKLRSRT